VLVGSAYLILKTTGELHTAHFKTAKLAAWTTLAGAVFISVTTPAFSEQLRERLLDPPLLYIFGIIPIVDLVLVSSLLRSLYRGKENTPIIWTFMLFALSFVGLGFVIFPQIIPPSVTIYEAAAAPSSLMFMLTFIGFLIPILLFYNIYNYIVFCGKIADKNYGEI